MIGKVINNYRITDFIDEGGMGTVYKGINIKLERPVAIKILHPNLTSNIQFRERFLNEARILAKLSHTNIINIFDFIEDDGQFYIVTEFVDGVTLDKRISISQRITQEDSIFIFKQILNGMQCAHEHNIVHRDLKPSNVMLLQDNTPKILDFGIAKLNESNRSLTKTGTKMGSLYYMSPEQVLGHNVDQRTDIYSLGIMLYEMITGNLPYASSTQSDYEVMNTILTQVIPDVNKVIYGLNPNINSIILKATAKEPSQRFSSCLEFLQAIGNENFIYHSADSSGSRTVVDERSVRASNTIFMTAENVSQSSSVLQAPVQGKKMRVIIFGSILLLLVTIAIYVSTQQNDTNARFDISKKDTLVEGADLKRSDSKNLAKTTQRESPSMQVVRNFIDDLGRRDFRSAYEKQMNNSWGTYGQFSSTKSFGGITSTSINDLRLNHELYDDASVTVDYFSNDPSNKDGRYVQEFFLKKFYDGWKIVKVKNISIEQW